MKTNNEELDVITLELIDNAMGSIMAQMTLTVIYAASTAASVELSDFAAGLCDAEGNVLANGLSEPGHLLGLSTSISSIYKFWSLDEMKPGDVFICNDPYEGGTHLPDVTVVRPIFFKGDLIAFSGMVAHQLDIGGRIAGGNACDNSEIYQEGLRIPPLKYYDQGVRNRTLFELMQKNIRVSNLVLEDIESQVAATSVGEKRFLELVNKYTWPVLHRYISELINYAEKMTKAEIKALPDGIYEAEDFLDDDGFSDEPVKICVKVIIDGDDITFDFSGSASTTRGSINVTGAETTTFAALALRVITDLSIPSNSGLFRPIKVILPEDSIINVKFPGAVAGRGVTVGRLMDVLYKALTKAVPDRLPACPVHLDQALCLSGIGNDDKPFVYVDFPSGSWGGSPWADGNTAITPIWAAYSNIPCEVMENQVPIRMEQCSFVPDSGGPGRHRGGLAMIREWRILTDNVVVQWRQDRAHFPPWGSAGGKNGTPARAFHISRDKIRELKKEIFVANKGDLIRGILAGGGGWGNPFERDVQKVLEDVRNDMVSIEAAKKDYGVVIDKDTMQINIQETKILRENNYETGS